MLEKALMQGLLLVQYWNQHVGYGQIDWLDQQSFQSTRGSIGWKSKDFHTSSLRVLPFSCAGSTKKTKA